jgi:hypothetical protein
MPWVAISCPHYVRKIAPARWRKRPSKRLRDRCSAAKTCTLWIGGWARPTFRGATGVNFCKLPTVNADTLAGRRRQDVDRCLKVPRIMPLLELL